MMPTDKMPKTDAEWRDILTPEQFHMLREKGTEAPGTGEYEHTEDKGTYLCAACGAELFPSDTKYHSGSGWPSFWAPSNAAALATEQDRSLGLARTEIKCARCGGHLGHVFDDGPSDKTGKRFCVNSASLKLKRT